jgi:alkylation response protein AidB-like acyl-CoA dehydrogenase
MDFAQDQTQREIAELASHVLGRVVERPADQAWRDIVDAGLLGLALPQRWGGDGLGLCEAAVVLTEVGRRAVPTPLLATLGLGALPLARSATEQQQDAILPRVVKEGLVLTAALHEPTQPMPIHPRTVAHSPGGPGDGYVVTGTKIAVPYADRAHRILIPVTLAGGGVGLLLIDPRAPGVTVTPEPSAGHEPHHRLSLDNVEVAATELVGGNSNASSDGTTVRDLYQVAIVAAALTADGLLAGALALTAEHVTSRHQFGRPLATLQAVAQQIADVYVVGRALHLVAWSACWRLADGREPGADPAVAGHWVAEQLRPAVGVCHHLHGGLGLDRSYPLHRFSAAATELARFVGGPDRGLDLLGDELFGETTVER